MIRHGLAWLAYAPVEGDAQEQRLARNARDQQAVRQALEELFAQEGFPQESAEYALHWRRDILGKPSVAWEGELAAWAQVHGIREEHLQVSNTHDGKAHLVFAAYDADLIGVGVDVVHLPRLRAPGKDPAYLRRFVRQFMSEEELAGFTEAAQEETEAALRVRVAAHFSLMEAASKACGTGLRLGIGMGRETALSKKSLGVRSLSPHVELIFGPEAQARLSHLGATRWEAHWGADSDYVVSVVLLLR